MRKSLTHLKDASRLLSTNVNSNKKHSKRIVSPFLSIPFGRSTLIRTLRCMSSTSTMTLTNDHDHYQPRSSFHWPINLSHLDQAIQSRHADQAWSLFITLVSQQPIPLSTCCSLYSLLKYAMQLSVPYHKKKRQHQLDRLLDYVAHQTSLDLFLSSVKPIPITIHKQLAHAIKANRPSSAWVLFFKWHQTSPTSPLPRTFCLKLMRLMMSDKRLTHNQRKTRLQLIALHGSGSTPFDARYLSSADLNRIAHILEAYETDQAQAHHLIDAFLSGLPKKKNRAHRADALDELIWHILPDLPKAHQVLKTADREGHPINEMVFLNLMDAYGKQRKTDQALALFETLLQTHPRPPSTRAFNTILHLFATDRISTRANQIFDKMIQLGVRPDVATYTELIRATRQTHYYYGQLINQGLKPTVYTFSALIEADPTHDWIRPLLEAGLQPNTVILTSLSKRWAPDQVIEMARQAGIRLDAGCYTRLLTESDSLASALTIQRQMQSGQVQANTYTYTTLIHLFGQHQMPEMADRLFRLMKDPNTITYSVMLDVWRKAGRLDKLEDLRFEFLRCCKSDKTGRFWLDPRIRNKIKAWER